MQLGLHDMTLGRFSSQKKKIEGDTQRKKTLICMFLIQHSIIRQMLITHKTSK